MNCNYRDGQLMGAYKAVESRVEELIFFEKRLLVPAFRSRSNHP